MNTTIAILKKCIPALTLVSILSMAAFDCGESATVNFGFQYTMRGAPQWTPDGSSLVFEHGGSIYEVTADGSSLKPVYAMKKKYRDAHSPSLSPSGDRVVYSLRSWDSDGFSYDLVSSKLDGSGVINVTGHGFRAVEPVWSPDGSKISYLRNVRGRYHLATVNPDGTGDQVIAPDIEILALERPTWSPDGMYLSFVGREKGKTDQSWGLYTAKRDGAELNRVTKAVSSAGVWSPDSTRLAFFYNDGFHTGVSSIYEANRDGTGLREIFDVGREYYRRVPGQPGMVWSPDGSEIRFGGPPVGYLDVNEERIALYRSSLSSTVWGGQKPVGIHKAVWSPDSSRVAAFVIFDETQVTLPEEWEILISMQPDGTNRQVLVKYNKDKKRLIPGLGEGWNLPYEFTWEEILPNPCPGPRECDERSVSDIPLVRQTSLVGAGYDLDEPIPTVEDLVEKGLFGAGASPAHIALRGPARRNSTRCEWRGVARTAEQREQAVRFWLNISSDEALPSADELERRFTGYIDQMVPYYQDAMQASFIPLARGGLTNEYQFLTCYVDYDVNEYLLGDGPVTVTVAYNNMGSEAVFSYNLYAKAHEAGAYDDEALLTPQAYQETLDQKIRDAEAQLTGALQDRGAVMLLAPMAAHHVIAIEAWQVVGQWDLQLDADNQELALRYGLDESEDEYSQTLTNLKSRITTAAAGDGFAGQRITNVAGLNQYYRDVGAYSDITPSNGDNSPFIPLQPLPVQTCAGLAAGGTEVDGIVDIYLTRDCSILLDLKYALAGTATLNWSKNTAIASWTGVTLSGTPQRVTGLDLSSESLNGAIPPGLGRLHGLMSLDLSSNQLTGAIPASLGELSDLSTLKLSGNALSGCIPPALRDVTTNDLASVGLSYCDMLTPPPAPDEVELAPADATFTITWDVVRGADNYEPQYQTVTGDEWTALPETEGISTTYTPDGGLACGTVYRFRVRAYGDGTMHSAAWGSPSDEVTHGTEACNEAPDFDPDSYAFTVDEDAAVGHVVGTVSAPDADAEDTVSYSITAGNGDGKFDIGGSSGEITVEDSLDHETVSLFNLTVQADDGRGGTDSAAVEIRVNDVAEDPAPPPSDLGVSLSGSAFTLTWTEVSGAARYEAQHRASDAEEWTALTATETTGATYAPEGGPACGTAYQFRVRSYGDGELYAQEWGPESDAEEYATEACNQAPDFDPENYSFTVDETALTSTLVGTVSAPDLDEGDVVSYSITGGNEDGKFTIAGDTGAIMLAATLDQTLVSSYTLTVRAEDGNGGEDTARISIAVASVCRDGTVIPDPGDNPGLVADCLILYGAKDTLAGTASLDWNGNTALADWPGVNVDARRVLGLELEDMDLDGVVPTSLGGIGRLRRLDLSGNDLTGTIPTEMGNLSLLKYLDLRDNSLDGTIPTVLGSLRYLERLHLDGNQLNGTIPTELGNLTRLDRLDLGDNMLTGTIPAELGNLRMMEDLRLLGNQLTGTIPSQLGNLSVLERIYLSDNQLDGEIPEELGNLSLLEVLGLEINLLSGEIPEELSNLDVLRQMLLADNNLTGTIPEELGDMPALEELWVAGNQLSGTVPLGLARLELTDLFLSENSFTGCLPHGLRNVERNDHQLDPVAVMPDCANEGPVFAESSYTFTVGEDAATGNALGSMTAADPDGRTVGYAITVGNDAGKFRIDAASGELSVAAVLDYETATSYTLTVQAEDGYELTSEVTVTIRVTDVAE